MFDLTVLDVLDERMASLRADYVCARARDRDPGRKMEQLLASGLAGRTGGLSPEPELVPTARSGGQGYP